MERTPRTPSLGLWAGLLVLVPAIASAGSVPGEGTAGRPVNSPSRRTAAVRLGARWLGQDRHDYCGAKDAIKPNGIQDVHIVLGGLPPRREVRAAWVYGHGAGEWQYRGVQNNHGVVLLRRPGSTTADLFLEPYQVETGREFHIKVKFDDGSESSATFRGGRADPDLRMPEAALVAAWGGQEKQDYAGAGPGVGPDGIQDAKIVLSRLSAKEKVAAVLLEHADGTGWAFGPNPEGRHNAELVRNEATPTEASLYFHPDADLAGRTLKVTVAYENGKKDSATLVGGRTDPGLAMPTPELPKFTPLTLRSRWLGQDGSAVTGPGDVHVSVAGLPPGRDVVAVVLTDAVRGVWVYRAGDRPGLDVEDGAAPLGFKAGSDRSTADLYFRPVRDETGTDLALRLVFDDGTTSFGTVAGGASDPALGAPAVDGSEVVARPGDDLGDLANRHGTVRLSKGNYALRRPLVLNRPVTIAGEPGAVLTFSQGADEAPWTAAIKVHAGNTTLRDFAVRFAGPVRWRTDVGWGPAVIGTTDNLDGVKADPKVNLTFSGLDLEGPQKSGTAAWEETPRLMRLRDATCGKVVKNTLRGGLIHLFGGPWEVVDNEYKGTPPGTFTGAVFVVHEPHDVVVRNNRAKPVGPSGKTWRFLTFVQRGARDVVEGNVVEGIGPRDDDTIPSANAPEIVLTESYYLWFEGRPAAVSDDGRVLKVDRVALAPRTGDVVSVLSGTGAGQWRRIAQRIEPTVFLLDAPLPRGAGVVSISPGFVNDVYAGNTVDARGGRAAAGFVLAGNHFGTVVRNNRVVGAGDAFQVMASASETPNVWGWSHAPVLGLAFEDNVIEDSERGGVFGVSHGGLCKSNKGRVYMTLALKANTVLWSEGFLNRRVRAGAKHGPAGITIGYAPSLDTGELVVEERDDRLVAPARAASLPALRVRAAVFNGQEMKERLFALPGRREAAVTNRADAVGRGEPGR